MVGGSGGGGVERRTASANAPLIIQQNEAERTRERERESRWNKKKHGVSVSFVRPGESISTIVFMIIIAYIIPIRILFLWC